MCINGRCFPLVRHAVPVVPPTPYRGTITACLETKSEKSLKGRFITIDNCLHSLTSKEGAKNLVDQLCSRLASGGFELRQWASNCSPPP